MARSAPLSLAQAPAMAMGMTYLAMADSISLAMQNAVSNQQRGQVTAAAAVNQTLVLIIKLGANPK
ncbi:RebB family R body protein [Hydrogenophaga luteola]|uniref:RebB family R body protein n=1 Tax=Hydrogenophaga luteola TaxID=1591122 RepID=A0ABV7W1P5_9BURK